MGEEDALKAATFRRLHPRLYLERFLAEDVRPDGRAEVEFRKLAVNVGAFSLSYCYTMLTYCRIDHERGWLGSCEARRHNCRLRRQAGDRGT